MGMMSSFNACFIILVPIIFSIGAIDISFDFYYFVQQWPVSFCNSKSNHSGECCYLKTGNRPLNFSIHGLWPTYKNATGPKVCDHRRLKRSQIPDLMTDLDKYWGALNCSGKTGLRFWKHEWKIHGTCSFKLDQHSYFKKTLSLKKKIDLLGALEAAGIHPNGGKYNLSRIEEAIGDCNNGTGKRPRVMCNKNREGKSQLFEVYVCVKLDASTVIDCKRRSNCNSSEMVVFPNIMNGTESEMVVFPAFGDDDLEALDEL